MALKIVCARFLTSFCFWCTALATLFNLSSAQYLWSNAPRGSEAPVPVKLVEPELPILNGICTLPSMNPCAPLAKCVPSVPLIGKAVCVCPPGYGGDGMKPEQGGQGCVNIDECRSGLHDCDLNTQECVDVQGSYYCKCKPGYTTAPNGKTCLDIDECRHPSLNNCDPQQTICHNLEGKYRCDCINPAQIIDEISGSCRDMNECEDLNGAMNPCEQICIDQIGGVSCDCEPGYQLLPDGRRCEDINECLDTTLHTCDPQGVISRCFNTIGSYNCECNQQLGYETAEDHKTCRNFNECQAYPYICGGALSCCKDLPPPQRFACTLPTDEVSPSTFLNAVTTLPNLIRGFSADETEESFAENSSTLGDEMDDHLALLEFWNNVNSSLAHKNPFDVEASSTYVVVIAHNQTVPQILQQLYRSSSFQDNFTDFSSSAYTSIASSQFLKSRKLQGLPSSFPSGASGFLNNVFGQLKSPNFGSGLRLGRGTNCPQDFSLGSDLHRKQVREQARNIVKTALASGALKSDGTRQPIAVTDVTDGIVTNTNAISSELTKWYDDLAALPMELVNAANQHHGSTNDHDRTHTENLGLASVPADSAPYLNPPALGATRQRA